MYVLQKRYPKAFGQRFLSSGGQHSVEAMQSSAALPCVHVLSRSCLHVYPSYKRLAYAMLQVLGLVAHNSYALHAATLTSHCCTCIKWPSPMASVWAVHLVTLFIACVGFIGYARVIAQIMSDHSVRNKDSDQLYYTELYLDKRVGG